MNADAYLSPYGIAINPVGGMFGDGTIDGAGVASVGSERGGLTACRGFDNSATTVARWVGHMGPARSACNEGAGGCFRARREGSSRGA